MQPFKLRNADCFVARDEVDPGVRAVGFGGELRLRLFGDGFEALVCVEGLRCLHF